MQSCRSKGFDNRSLSLRGRCFQECTLVVVSTMHSAMLQVACMTSSNTALFQHLGQSTLQLSLRPSLMAVYYAEVPHHTLVVVSKMQYGLLRVPGY